IVIGSAIIFSLSRIYGRMFVEKFVNKKLIEKYENLINSPKGESVIFLMLLLPFFPDDVINFIVGISNMSFKKYFVILMLTRPWEILLASALGSASLEMPLGGWGVIIIVSYFIIVKSSKIEEKLTKLIKK
ncbi:MAG: VTT domain-containing protein, partial [Clostridium sp.]|uniref:TVP38/TMEM64 family protein n=1 Tax=Clostridium sp. TaxID=1506 RepID=UPI00290C7635